MKQSPKQSQQDPITLPSNLPHDINQHRRRSVPILKTWTRKRLSDGILPLKSSFTTITNVFQWRSEKIVVKSIAHKNHSFSLALKVFAIPVTFGVPTIRTRVAIEFGIDLSCASAALPPTLHIMFGVVCVPRASVVTGAVVVHVIVEVVMYRSWRWRKWLAVATFLVATSTKTIRGLIRVDGLATFAALPPPFCTYVGICPGIWHVELVDGWGGKCPCFDGLWLRLWFVSFSVGRSMDEDVILAKIENSFEFLCLLSVVRD